MSADTYTRFKDAPWFPGGVPVSIFIGGAGGIGSWLSFFLTRIGYFVTTMDFDTLEAHNLGGQLFKNEDLGKYKVEAVESVINSYSIESNYIPIIGRVTHTTVVSEYVFSAFDNMRARKDLFEAWKKHNAVFFLSYELEKQSLQEEMSLLTESLEIASNLEEENPSTTKMILDNINLLKERHSLFLEMNPMPIFIDGRLEMEQLQIFCVTPNNIEKYEATLFDDNAVEEIPCTMKQTSHSAAMIATLMTSFFTNHLTNVREGMEVREVPFYHEFFIPMGLTNNSY